MRRVLPLLSNKLTLLAFAIITMSGVSNVMAQSKPPLHAAIRGVDMGTYARIIMSLDELPKQDIKINNGILIWRFDTEIDGRLDRLQTELPNYIAGARLDPDRKAIRIALQQPLTSNVQDAGTDLYLDLLPKSWKGPYPSLPADVVHDLSRRARVAEEALRQLQRKPSKPLTIDVANSKAVTLLRFHSVAPDDVKITERDGMVDANFTNPFQIVNAQWSQSLPVGLKLISSKSDDDKLSLSIKADREYRFRFYFDDQTLVFEFAKQKAGLLLPREDEPITTGSIAETFPPDPPNVVLSPDHIVMDTEMAGDDPAMLIGAGDDVARAIFVDGTKLFIVLDTEHVIAPTERMMNGGEFLSRPDLISSGSTKALIVRLKEQRVPVLEKVGEVTRIKLHRQFASNHMPLDLVAHVNARDERRALISLSDVARIVSIDDPETGYHYRVAPSRTANLGFASARQFPEFQILASGQGVAIRPIADDLDIHADVGAVVLSRPSGQLVLSSPDDVDASKTQNRGPILRASSYRRLADDEVQTEIRQAIDAINQAEPRMRALPRIKLARLYAAQGLYREAVAMMDLAILDIGLGKIDPRDELERAFYNSLSGRHLDSLALYARNDVANHPEAALFLAFDLASQAKFEEAMAAYRRSESVLAQYPRLFVQDILPVLAEAALEAHDVPTASNLVASLQSYQQGENADRLRYLTARLFDLTGKYHEAIADYKALATSLDPRVQVKAKQALLKTEPEIQRMTSADRLAEYDAISLLWRGDFIEARTLMGIAENALASGEWRRGFGALKRLNLTYPDIPGVRAMLDTATTELEQVFDGPKASQIGSVEAVSLFMEFREFAPVGRRGDDVIRKLADRLAALDLLPQAAELMRYQLENRLEGIAKAVAAPKLAYILLMDRKPKDALQILADTRMNGIDDELQRSRLLLEARAHADLGDVEGALDLVSQYHGEDVARLRAEIAWRARDWQKAAELSERVIGDQWRDGQTWPDALALYALRSAIGYALADDRLALDRLRGRFTSRLTDRPEAPAFRFLTAPLAKSAPLTSEYASSFPGGSAIDGFMSYYQDRYLKPAASGQNSQAPNSAKSG